jgi:hypothetical protein
MDFAGSRTWATRFAARLRPRRPGSAMRRLAAELTESLRTGPEPPSGVRELCLALCAEMGARRGGRPVELRFERFPDELEVTGLWVEFNDFDLVIVEERAEAVQQLVILGHELWHMHAGHRHHRAGGAAGPALARWDDDTLSPGLTASFEPGGTPIAARNGSREADEAEADDFGHRLAALLRGRLTGGERPLDPVQRTLGYRGRRGAVR